MKDDEGSKRSAAEQQFRREMLPLKDKLFRLALRITLDRSEAEDITQETLVRMWTLRDEWATIDSIEAYCLSVCHRLAIDHIRKVQLHAEKESDIIRFQRTVVHAEKETDERLDIVRSLMDQLPETQRTIMVLRDIEGMRYDEIARITGLTETQVKVYLHRARTRIKEKIGKKL